MQKATLCNWPAYWRNQYITKTLLVMKLTILLLAVGFLNVSATGLSQEVTFSGKNVSLEKYFQKSSDKLITRLFMRAVY